MKTTDTDTFGGRFRALNENLDPADFAMVMSTGIVSVALHLLGFGTPATVLFWINIAMFVVLWPLYLLKLVRFPRRMLADFRGHASGPGFLTIVAGTCILGNQYAVLTQDFALAHALFWLGVCCWAFLLWGVFYAIFTVEEKPPLSRGINGAWLVATVSTQSIVILGATIADKAGWNPEIAFFLFCALFLLGVMLYIFVITVIFFRFCFAKMTPAELDPTYWINAGAVAISTLAGATLILKNGASPMLDHFMPYIKGTTLLTWATASWWVPLLLLLGFWRHVVRRYPLTYTPAFWGMVFPMGMYTACTVTFSEALGFGWLMVVPRWFLAVAFGAWVATFVGMLISRVRLLFVGPRQA